MDYTHLFLRRVDMINMITAKTPMNTTMPTKTGNRRELELLETPE